MFSWLEPWGSWQLAQLSFTGACTHRNGPRFSAWHVKQVSLGEASLRSDWLIVPCGLWHEVQVILPSRSGMCEVRIVWARFCRWQVPQVSITVSLASWWRGETFSMTLWQFVQATSRDSCALPCQKMRAPLVWHDRHTAFRFSTGVRSFFANVISPPLPLPPPASTWSLPGPWQLSQALASRGLRACFRKRRPILVWENLLNASSWQPLQVSAPT